MENIQFDTINFLKFLYSLSSHGSSYSDLVTQCYLDYAIEAIENYSPWISCSKRLPDSINDDMFDNISDYVLISTHNAYYDDIIIAFYDFSKNDWYINLDTPVRDIVLGWMPLPKSYNQRR